MDKSCREGGKCPPQFVNRMIDKELIANKVAETIAGTDQFIVSIQVKPGNIIEIVLDSDTNMSIDDCVKVSRAVESSLDRENEDFELSVFSAGLSEPLQIERQYKKHLGKEIEVILKSGIKLIGTLVAFKNGILQLQYQKKQKPEGAKRKVFVNCSEQFDLSEIKSTKLIIKV